MKVIFDEMEGNGEAEICRGLGLGSLGKEIGLC